MWHLLEKCNADNNLLFGLSATLSLKWEAAYIDYFKLFHSYKTQMLHL